MSQIISSVKNRSRSQDSVKFQFYCGQGDVKRKLKITRVNHREGERHPGHRASTQQFSP